MEEAERLLRNLQKDHLCKRQRQSPTGSSDSEDDGPGGDGESNKKKRVYQSQLPWYTVEIAAQAREVDGNRKINRETLAILQKDLRFAE